MLATIHRMAPQHAILKIWRINNACSETTPRLASFYAHAQNIIRWGAMVAGYAHLTERLKFAHSLNDLNCNVRQQKASNLVPVRKAQADSCFSLAGALFVFKFQ